MKVRVTGAPAECEQLLKRLAQVLQVFLYARRREVDRNLTLFCALGLAELAVLRERQLAGGGWGRGGGRCPSVLGRVHLDVELSDATEQTAAERTDTGPVSLVRRALRGFLAAWDDVGASWKSLEAPVATMRRALRGDR